jgi:hypothetical protein
MIVHRSQPKDPIAMNAFRAVARKAVRAALLAAAIVPATRADDDVVKSPEAAPPKAPVVGGQVLGGRVIFMPGLQLQVGAQGQAKGQGLPPAGAAAAGEVRKEAYLGVVAAVITPPVRAQLDLPEGVGLSIDAVAVGSPAEKAGVKQFDVIHKFNDQVICSPEQLVTLVKVAGVGTAVPLKLIRGGREKVVEVVIAEREVPEVGQGPVVVAGGMPGVWNVQAIPPGAANVLGPRFQAEVEAKLAEALTGAGGGGVPPGLQGNVRAQVLTIGPNAQSATAVSDARGTVEIRSAGGKKTVSVKDPAGKEVYSGALDTDDDLKKVPEDYRDWVREVHGGQPAVELGPVDEPEPAAAG